MRVQMHRLMAFSLALAMAAGLMSVAPVMAQSPEEPFGTSAGLNADRVDGFHAVKSSGSPAKRKGKLMAFSAKGYLPDNAIKKARDADLLDGLDSTAFATLAALQSSAGAVNEADNPVHWNQLQGVPPTIADGVDNVGVTGIRVTRVIISRVSTIADGFAGSAEAPCPPGSVIVGGGFSQSNYNLRVTDSFPIFGTHTWRATGRHMGAPTTGDTYLTAYALCLSVEPAAALTTAKKGIQPATKKRGK